jgi:hypothetical protein
VAQLPKRITEDAKIPRTCLFLCLFQTEQGLTRRDSPRGVVHTEVFKKCRTAVRARGGRHGVHRVATYPHLQIGIPEQGGEIGNDNARTKLKVAEQYCVAVGILTFRCGGSHQVVRSASALIAAARASQVKHGATRAHVLRSRRAGWRCAWSA